MQKLSFIIDNVLDEKDFKHYQDYLCNTSVYRTIQPPPEGRFFEDQKFHVTDVPFGLQNKINETLKKTHNCDIKVLASMVRQATQYLNNDWGIHADIYVGEDEKPEYGAVFYLTENSCDLNGTALWKHKEHGYCAKDNFFTDNVDKAKDSYNDIDQWQLSTVFGGIENRLVSYPAEYFHSKFPKQAWGTSQKDGRVVLAMFYSLQKNT